MKLNIISIDAWRDADGGWTWNDWHTVRTIELPASALTPRKLLNALRREGILTKQSCGRVAVEETHGEHFFCEVQAKNTREPLISVQEVNE